MQLDPRGIDNRLFSIAAPQSAPYVFAMDAHSAPSPAFLDRLRKVVGDAACVTDPDALERFVAETRGLYRGATPMAVRPANTEQVADVVKLCAAEGVGIVPMGGNTGLCGGAVAAGEIVLSLDRMNKVRAIDPANHTITVEAGCILADVQAAADEAGCLFPLSLAAEGSCRIGGNVSTNAGGVNVLRYGNARELVLGLEVVLPDGRVWDGLRGLRKDNTGYDLKQLFIGAEGTLGVVTAAVLKLYPKVRTRATAFVGLADPDRIANLFARLRNAAAERLSAFEFIPRLGLDFVLGHIPDIQAPLSSRHAFYVLAELTSPLADDRNLTETLETVLAGAIEAGIADDAALAQSEGQANAFWRIRESMPEAQKGGGGSIKHDVSVPISRLPEFLARAGKIVTAMVPGVRVCAFGHWGDGNVHYNLSQPEGMDRDAFMAHWKPVAEKIHDLVRDMGGSFSAEHGVGKLKIDDMMRYKSDVERDLMRTLKTALDPKNIMNPGKVVGP